MRSLRRLILSRISRVLAGEISRRTIARVITASGIFAVLIASLLTFAPTQTALAGAGINQAIDFQGKLVNSNGTNIANGTYNMEFNIYTGGGGCVTGGSSPCGGSLQWTEDYLVHSSQGVSVSDGIFHVNLGSITALPAAVFNNDTVWLSINLGTVSSTCTTFSGCGGDGEMTPFIRFTASPYSMNSMELGGLTASEFAQLSPASAQSGYLNVTGNVTSGATVAATTSLQAPLVDTSSAIALDIGTGTASSVTIGRTTTPFTIQGNSTSTITATSGSYTSTLGFQAPSSANDTLTLPNAGGTICTTVASTCSGTYATGSTSGSYLAKNGSDTSAAVVTAANYLYGFTNSQTTATTGGVLDLSNGANTGDTLLVTASGNPAASTDALVVVNNTTVSPSGNLIDLQNNGSNELSVDYNGNVTQNGGTATTDTINGQTISAAANFTGTVTAVTSVFTPTIDSVSGALAIGTTNATQINLKKNTVVSGSATVATSTNQAGALAVNNSNGESVLSEGTAANANGITNYIADPDFFVGSGTSLTDWIKLSTPTTWQQNTAAADSYDGSTSLNMVTTTASGQGASSTVFTSAPPTASSGGAGTDHFYTLSFEAMQTAGATLLTGSNFEALAVGGGSPNNTCTINGSGSNTLSATGSEQVVCTLTFTSGSGIGTIKLQTAGTISTADTLYISDVQLQQGSTASAVQLGNTQLRGVINTPVAVQNATNSNSSFEVQNANGSNVLAVDTLNGQTVLGSSNSVGGSLVLDDAASTNTATLQLQGTLPGNAVYQLPNVAGTQVICTTLSTSACSSVYQVAGSYLLQNPAANDASSSSFAGYQYSFTQNSTGAAGNLQLTNAGTNPSLDVVGTGNPSGTNAIAVINNTAGTPSGNLLDIQKGGANELSVDYNGNINQANGTTTTDTINGQTISSAASFTGTVTAATSMLAPAFDTASAGTLSIGGTTATAINVGNATTNPSVAFNGSGTFATTTGAVSLNGATTVTGTNTLTVNGGLTTLKAGLTVTNGGNVAFQKATDISTTGILNNQAITGALVRFTGASAQTLTGVAGGADGRILTIVNAASQAMTLKNNDTTDSSAANVIITGTGGDLSVPAGSTLMLVYDAGANVWRVSSGTVAATGGYIQNQNAVVQTGNFNISGTGQSATSFLTPTLDTATGVTLNIGNTTATAINIGRSGITTTVTGGLTQQTGAVSLTGNAASSFTTSSGALTLTSAAAATWSTTAGNLTIQAAGGTVSLGSSGTLTNTGALTVTGGSTLTLGSTGANAVSIDTGGGAAINVGGTNATSLNFGNATSNPSVAFTGSGTFGTTTGANSLNGATTVTGSNTLTVNGGLTTLKAGLTVTNGGNVAFQKATDISTTGILNNQAITGALVRFTGASAQTLTGIAGGADGRILTLVNAASQAMTVKNNDTTDSSAANVIITGTGGDLSVPAGSTLMLVYDAGANVWRVSSGTVAATGGYIQNQNAVVQTGNFNISGTGQSATSFLTPTIDTTTGVTLNIGNTTATAINIGRSGITTTVTGGLTQQTGAVSLTGNAASSFTTSSGALTLTSAAAATWSTTAGNLTIQAAGGTVSLGSSSTLSSTGALTITGGSTLALGSTGANTVSIDTGGGAAINVGGTNATSLNFGNATSNPSVGFTGSGTFGTTTGANSLNGATTVTGTNTLTVNGGLTTLKAGLTVTNGGNVAFQKATDISTTGTLNNESITGALVRFTGASAQTLTGIAGGADGRILTLVNAAGQAMTVKNNDTTDSSAANVIITGTGADVTVPAGASLMVVYDAGASVWRVTSGSVAATGGYIQNQNAVVQTGNFNISGTGQSATSFLTPTLDTATGVTLNIGNTTATAINIGRSGITTTVTGGLTQQTGAVSLTGNAASSFTTSAGALTLTSAAAATWSTTAGNLTIQAAGGTVSLGSSSTLSNTGALTVTGGSTLALGSTGANTVSLDTGGAAAVNIAGTNANAVNVGNVTSNPSIGFTGSGTFGTTTGANSLNGATTVTGSNTFTVNGGLTTLKAGLTVTNGGNVAFQKTTDISTTGTLNNESITGALVRFTGASAQTLTGVAGGADGRILTLVNAAGQAMTVKNNDTTDSSAANVIITGTGGDLSVPAGATLMLVYDAGANVWRVSSGTVAATGGYIQNQNASVQTGNFNISGTGQLATSLLTPTIDTASAVALNVGNTTASAINIGRSGITTTVTGGLTQQTGAVSLTGNAASSFTTSSGALTLTSAAAATWSTTAGNLTIQAAAGTVSLGTSTQLTATGALTLTAGAANALTITSPVAATWSTNAGALSIDSAAGLNLGTTNATSVAIGKSTTTATVNGTLQVGATTGTGAVFNNGSTTNKEDALTNFASSATMVQTAVDNYSYVSIAQTTTGITVTVPAPTANTAFGKVLYISNIGTASVVLSLNGTVSNSLAAGSTATLVWANKNGTAAWSFAGADAGSLQSAYNASAGATPSIAENTANGALTVQASVGGFTNSELFGVRSAAGTDTTLGPSDFSVTASGVAIGLGSTSNNPTVSYNLQLGNGTATAQVIQVTSAATAAQAGAALTVQAATGSTSGLGGQLNLNGGAGGNAAAGGQVVITGGASGGGATAGGAVTLQGGASNATAGSNGGAATLQGGNGTSTGTGGVGGNVAVNGGSSFGSNANAGGTATIQGGTGSPSGVGGAVTVQGGSGGSTSGNGGLLTLQGGTAQAGGTSVGGGVTIQGGTAAAVAGSQGGAVSITAGAGTTTGTGAAGNTVTIGGGAGGGTAAGSAGGAVTVDGGNASGTSTTAVGGDITLQAGSTTDGGNAGNIHLTAGNTSGGGTPGVVYIDTPVFTSSGTTDSFSTTNTMAVGLIDNNSTVVVNATAANLTLTIPAPTNNAIGRTVYITVANGSNNFTMSLTGGPTLNMLANTTAALVYNGTGWTGGSAASSLQQVYNDTSTSPASIVTTSSTKTLLVQAGSGDDASNLFSIDNSFGSPAFNINSTQSITTNGTGTASTSTNLIQNPSIEANPLTASGTAGGYSAVVAGTTVTRSTNYAYAGNASLSIAAPVTTGAGAVQAITSSTGTATALTASTTYYMSWYANGAGTAVTNVIAEYAYNGSTFTNACTPSNTTISAQYGWTRYTCSFTTGSGGTAPTTANAIEIIQNSAQGATHTFYLDALQLETTGVSPYEETSEQDASVITSPVDLWNTNNSTTALSVQNAAGTSLFNVDTLNGAVNVTNASYALTGNAASSLTTTTGSLTITSAAAGSAAQWGIAAQGTAATAGGALTVYAGTGNTSGAGGQLNLNGGTGGNAAAGGAVAIAGGAAGGGNFGGGGVTLTGGAATGTGAGGGITLQGGSAAAVATSTGGTVAIDAGGGSTTGAGTGGSGITLQGGAAGGSGNNAGGGITLQAGNGINTGASGSIIAKSGTNNSATAFQVQNASGAAVQNTDTTDGNGCVEDGLQATATSGSYATCVGQSHGNGTLIVNSGTQYYSGLAFAQLNSTDVNTTNTTSYNQLLGIDANGNVGISNAAVSLTSPALAYWDGSNDPTLTPAAPNNSEGYAYPTPTATGSATFVSSALGERLTTTTANTSGSLNWSFAQVPFEEVQFQFQSGGGTGADATWFYSYANSIPTSEYGASMTACTQNTTGTGCGYIIYFDEYWDCIGITYGNFTDGHQCSNGGGTGYPLAAYAFSNGNGGATHMSADAVDDGNWHNVDIQFFYNQIIVRWDGQIVIDYSDTYGRDLSYQDFGFGSRNGSAYNNHYIKGLLVTKLGTNTSQYDINNVAAPLASNMYWDNSFNSGDTVMNQGALGVGTADPTATLEVDGTSQNDTIVEQSSASATVCQENSFSCGYTVGTTTAGVDVLGTGTSFVTSGVAVGDKITFQDGYSTTVASVVNNTELTVTASELEESNSTQPGVAFTIYRPTLSTALNVVQVGSGTGSNLNPTLLSLDTYSGSSGADPSGGTTGDMYYNSTSNEFRCEVNGAWQPCNGIWQTLMKITDTTIASNTTLTSDATMAFTMAANTNYSIRCQIYFNGNTTPGFKWDTTGPGSPTAVNTFWYWQTPAATSPTFSAITAGSVGTQTWAAGGTTDPGYIDINATWENGATSATWAPQFAQATSSATVDTIRAGSYCDYVAGD